MGNNFENKVERRVWQPEPVRPQVPDVNRRPRGWIALDDDYIDWPPEHRHQLIKTDPYKGISKPFVTKLLTRKLADLCS